MIDLVMQSRAASRPSRTERTLIMTMPSNVDVDDTTREMLAGLAMGTHDLLAGGLELRAEWQIRSGLDARSYALVKIAALIALDAPPASYLWQVAKSGIDKQFQDQVRGMLQPGTSALFLMVEKVTPDKAVETMSKYGGTVLKTSLSKEGEQQLQGALHGATT
jgi:hypothetical protein